MEFKFIPGEGAGSQVAALFSNLIHMYLNFFHLKFTLLTELGSSSIDMNNSINSHEESVISFD